MRYLVLSDLHSNWQALEAVIAAAAGHYDRALCCGDLIGYGADPNAVVTWVRANCAAVIRGNHDRAWTTEEDLGWFNPVARHAALWTGQALAPENAAYVTALARGPLLVDGFQLAHGSPYDEDEYMMSAEEATVAFEYMETRLAFLATPTSRAASSGTTGAWRRFPHFGRETCRTYCESTGTAGTW